MVVLFSDGFESGDFSAWLSVSPYGGGVASAIPGAARSGAFGAEVLVPLPALDTDWAGVWINYEPLVGQAEIFFRGYFYIADNFPMAADSRFYIMNAVQLLDNDTLVHLGIGNQQGDGLPHWRLIARNGIDYVNVWGGLVPTTLEWVCVELRIVRDAVNGMVQLFVNGVLDAEITGVDTTQILMERLRFGGEVPPVSPDYPGNVNFDPLRVLVDDCVVAEEYIGPDVPPPPCESHLTQAECEGAGCYWYDGGCHSSPAPPPPPQPDMHPMLIIGGCVGLAILLAMGS